MAWCELMRLQHIDGTASRVGIRLGSSPQEQIDIRTKNSGFVRRFVQTRRPIPED